MNHAVAVAVSRSLNGLGWLALPELNGDGRTWRVIVIGAA